MSPTLITSKSLSIPKKNYSPSVALLPLHSPSLAQTSTANSLPSDKPGSNQSTFFNTQKKKENKEEKRQSNEEAPSYPQEETKKMIILLILTFLFSWAFSLDVT